MATQFNENYPEHVKTFGNPYKMKKDELHLLANTLDLDTNQTMNKIKKEITTWYFRVRGLCQFFHISM